MKKDEEWKMIRNKEEWGMKKIMRSEEGWRMKKDEEGWEMKMMKNEEG